MTDEEDIKLKFHSYTFTKKMVVQSDHHPNTDTQLLESESVHTYGHKNSYPNPGRKMKKNFTLQ